jgi:hypothetical protein
MIEIAFSSDAPHFNQEHLIFGKHFVLEFQWIERENYWAMHLYDGAEIPIALSLRVTPRWPIYVDKKLDIAFLLLAKNPNAELSRSSLHKDFVLVVYAV